MCVAAVPLPRCADCVAEETELLEGKSLLTPGHPLIVDRLKQLRMDELLTDEALVALDAECSEAVGSEAFVSLRKHQSERAVLRSERDRLAGETYPLLAYSEDFTRFPLDTLLTVWAVHPSPVVRRRLAANPSTPVEVLNVLARDYDRDVLGAVMQNPNHGQVCFLRVAGNPHAAGGMAEIVCLMAAMLPPSSAVERAEYELAKDELTIEEKLRVIEFLSD